MHQRCKYIVTTAERTEAVRELVDGTEIDRIAYDTSRLRMDGDEAKDAAHAQQSDADCRRDADGAVGLTDDRHPRIRHRIELHACIDPQTATIR